MMANCTSAVRRSLLVCGALFLNVTLGPFRIAAAAPSTQSQDSSLPLGQPSVRDLRFTHLTTNDGLSQGYVVSILQDRRGFMWFATRDGLNRYDGNTFVVYKNEPDDPGSLSSNFIQDLIEDDHGALWIATNTGVNKFDPATERCTRYLHDPGNTNSLGGASVKSIAQDSRGYLWFGTEGSGLDRFDPASGNFTHYRNDGDGNSVGRISQVISGSHRDLWFVGARGLFHLNPDTGQMTRPVSARIVPSAESVYEDEGGNLWMLADSPAPELLRYEPRTARLNRYHLPSRGSGVLASTENGGSANGTLVADGPNGLWVPSSQGLYYFDRRTDQFPYRFQHDETNPDSLDSNTIMSVYRDRGGVLWVGTEHAGLNILDFRQEQFALYAHRPAQPNSLSPGRVKAIYQDRNGVVWAGFFPRALDKLDRKTGEITHYVSGPVDRNPLGPGTNVDAIYRDEVGHLWVGGGGSGLLWFDSDTEGHQHYRHIPGDPRSLISHNVYAIYGDRDGRVWVGQDGGLSRFDAASGTFTNYRPVPDTASLLANTVWIIYQDRSGAMWLGTWGGVLSRFDDNANAFVNQLPDPHDPQKLNGGGINSILEDSKGILWVGAMDGLYSYNRQNGTFQRYTEIQGLPSSTIRCILEDRVGNLWLGTQKGLSRFDPQRGTFRNYDVSDGLQSNEFSTGCFQAADGEMFFGGSDGFNAFFPENIHDNPYVPPVVITGLRIFNRSVPIGSKSVLKRAISYVDSLTLSYRDNVFSLDFAALSYANPQKNRYRYKLENFDTTWNEVGSKQRRATYTNLDPGRYVFRVQGSNSDGVWNEHGVSLSIVITPPWWSTTWFRALIAAFVLVLLWAAYQLRMQQVRHQFEITLDARVSERTRIARDLHDTLLQSFHGLLLRFQIVSELLPGRPVDAKGQLDKAIERAAQAITEGRDAVQGLRESVIETNDLAQAIRSLAEQLSADPATDSSPILRVTVEGGSRDLHPILRDEIYRIAGEALRNVFRHAEARHIEVEIRYGEEQFRLRVRDDGKGMETAVRSGQEPVGHFGLPGMRERAKLIGGDLVIWSEIHAGTEVELRIPAQAAYAAPGKHTWMSKFITRK